MNLHFLYSKNSVVRNLIVSLQYSLPVLSLPLSIFLGLAWSNRWWEVSPRVHYTPVTLAALGAIWWTHYWHLLGSGCGGISYKFKFAY